MTARNSVSAGEGRRCLELILNMKSPDAAKSPILYIVLKINHSVYWYWLRATGQETWFKDNAARFVGQVEAILNTEARKMVDVHTARFLSANSRDN